MFGLLAEPTQAASPDRSNACEVALLALRWFLGGHFIIRDHPARNPVTEVSVTDPRPWQPNSMRRGESISFCVTSLGRNPFLQVATGLFGGDPSWGIGSYTPDNDDYRHSMSFRTTVVTEDGMYQRAPVACWYAMSSGTVIAVTTTVPNRWTMRLGWSVSDGLWNTIRVPGQYLTFVESGRLHHAALTSATTQQEAVVTWESSEVPDLNSADMLTYMLRQRPPRAVIPGPIVVGDDRWTIHVEGNPEAMGFVPPEPGAHLLYVGKRGEHPLNICALDTDPVNARDWIFAVEAVSYNPDAFADGNYSLKGTPQSTAVTTWHQVTPWLAFGCVTLSVSVIPTGLSYQWPYASDEPGTVWLLAPREAGASPLGVNPPAAVWFVRAAVTSEVLYPAPTEGDRIALLDVGTNLPTGITEYIAGGWTMPPTPIPPDTLLVTETGHVAWWCTASAGPKAYRVVVMNTHEQGASNGNVRGFTDTGDAVDHAFILFTRRVDGLYAAIPRAITSNLSNTNPSGWTWTYPLSLADGTDRFVATAFTDGLLGIPQRGSASIDYAGIRRRMGPRLMTDPRPPEYLRVNVDMGGPVVMRAFAWAAVTDGAHPTLTVHGSNDPAFYVDQVVDIAGRIPWPGYSQNQHNLANGAECLWWMTFDTPGSAWTAADVAAGTADIYVTRLSDEPRYTRLYADGRPVGPVQFPLHHAPLVATTYPAYRYYALTISVGALLGSLPYTMEVQEFQPLVNAPDPSSALSGTVFARSSLQSATGVYTIRLGRQLPATTPTGVSHDLGYIEVCTGVCS